MKINIRRSIFIYLLIIVAVVAFFSFSSLGSDSPKDIPFSQVITMSQEGSIKNISIESTVLNITDMNGTKYRAIKESGVSIYEIPNLTSQVSLSILLKVALTGEPYSLNFLPFLLVGGLGNLSLCSRKQRAPKQPGDELWSFQGKAVFRLQTINYFLQMSPALTKQNRKCTKS